MSRALPNVLGTASAGETRASAPIVAEAQSPARDGQPVERRGRGRPRAITREVATEILAFIAGGGSRKAAASYVEIHYNTIAAQCRRDPDFCARLKHAESCNYMQHLRNITRAGRKDWRASAFYLERKFPEEFGRYKEVVKVARTDTEGNDVEFGDAGEARAYLASILAELRERAEATGELSADQENGRPLLPDARPET